MARVLTAFSRRAGRINVRRVARFSARPLLALLFGLQTAYLPFHLLTEPHHYEMASVAHVAAASSESHEHSHADEHGGEAHHSGADHAIQARPESSLTAASWVFLPAISASVVSGPRFTLLLRPLKRIDVHGQSPPGSLPARAPPAL